MYLFASLYFHALVRTTYIHVYCTRWTSKKIHQSSYVIPSRSKTAFRFQSFWGRRVRIGYFFLLLMLRATISLRLSRSLATHAYQPATSQITRHDWTKSEIQQIYDSPLLDLVFRAANVHRTHQDSNKIQLCTLMNIKCKQTSSFLPNQLKIDLAGGCSEDC